MPERGEATALPQPPAATEPARGKFGRWIWGLRTNSRFAFVVQVSSRIFNAGAGLIWTRLLTQAMGTPLMGLFMACQDVFTLGGLGDLGMGGAIGIRTGQYLAHGKSKEPELLRFLASARTVFIVLTLLCGCGMLILSPWIPHWKNFAMVSEAGSLVKVFEVGAVMVAGFMLFSYISNVNYACGNIAWPVLPDIVILQLTLACHLYLAHHAQPLWVQFLPYLAATFIKLWLMWLYVRASHPALSRLWPLAFDGKLALNLFEGSFWVYLCCLGNAIYRKTDNLVITAGFTPGTNTEYNFNYKACDLMFLIVTTASYVILPKVTQWMASSDPQDRERVIIQMRRLNQVQILLGCGAALGYLAFNNLFMSVWWYKRENLIHPVALTLQLAFALNMAVSASGDAALQLALRSGQKGLRAVGALIGLTGLLNVALSLASMHAHWLEGIALATVLAQSLLMLGASFYLCRFLKIAWLPWALKGCILPLIGIGLAGWLRMLWPMNSALHVTMLLGAYAAMFVAGAWALGVNFEMIRQELQIVRKLLGK